MYFCFQIESIMDLDGGDWLKNCVILYMDHLRVIGGIKNIAKIVEQVRTSCGISYLSNVE